MKNKKELIEQLKTFDVPELCDGMKEPRVMTYQIKPVTSYNKFAGTAVTVDIPPGITGLVPDGIACLKEDDVLVIAVKGYCERGTWGDYRSICAKMTGAAAVVTDGACRDISALEEAGFPVFAKAVCAASSSQERTGEINIPVECGGVEVLPGDLVIGDENGVLVLHPEEAEEVMEKALAKRLRQEKAVKYMRETGELLVRIPREPFLG